jgi:hypothetical protein
MATLEEELMSPEVKVQATALLQVCHSITALQL